MWFSTYLCHPASGARIASSLIQQSASNPCLVFPTWADAVSQRYRLKDICQSVRGWVPQRNVFLGGKKKKMQSSKCFHDSTRVKTILTKHDVLSLWMRYIKQVAGMLKFKQFFARNSCSLGKKVPQRKLIQACLHVFWKVQWWREATTETFTCYVWVRKKSYLEQ